MTQKTGFNVAIFGSGKEGMLEYLSYADGHSMLILDSFSQTYNTESLLSKSPYFSTMFDAVLPFTVPIETVLFSQIKLINGTNYPILISLTNYTVENTMKNIKISPNLDSKNEVSKKRIVHESIFDSTKRLNKLRK